MMPDLLFLANFPQLSELHLWGGQFYADNIQAAVAAIGGRLRTLFLIHTEQLDPPALRLISRLCPRLRTLGFYNCEFVTRQPVAVEDENGAAMPRRGMAMAVQIRQKSIKFQIF
jgi:hypothetical protein